MNNIKVFFSIIAILFLGVIATVIVRSGDTGPANGAQSGKYDAFATCLKDKGAIFYGAFWCPHCQEQKKLFGSSVKLLPYVECSTADGQGQLQVCKDKNIASYPTWKLADGTDIPNENSAGVTLETLAAKTSCLLPQ
jgi:thiol-disulfide isomerase/thioredoxin